MGHLLATSQNWPPKKIKEKKLKTKKKKKKKKEKPTLNAKIKLGKYVWGKKGLEWS